MDSLLHSLPLAEKNVHQGFFWSEQGTYLRWKCESEANVEENEEDEGEKFLAKLMVILLVGELVGVPHEGVRDCREESGGSSGGPEVVQGGMAL